jgi:hypothetical protein
VSDAASHPNTRAITQRLNRVGRRYSPMADYFTLIPELKDWNNGNGLDVDSWIGCTGTFPLAIGYSTLFWPSFVAFEGYVLREGFTIEGLRDWERHCGGNRRDIESVMNHLHIADTHQGGSTGISSERLVYLGCVLRDIYTAKLAWQFPERRFTVCFDDSASEDLTDYQLTFFQNDRDA